ncbi:nucleotidyltransferase domain-containing protein [Kineobactrum salinum]|uniref:Nucleotidyltransferase family protein n=1 Tax=Kineobactrum salinum TaxID=2708301 RepID=A0A6C0TY25_9GAMM|nr:nucleotidyltransferase family protein [Kineobactrum salinum]QIB64730.1 nucleotidyltransferase family protein [Kineobactrum salinum]
MNLLTQVLREPERLADLGAAEFFELAVQADAAGLLGRIWHLAQREGIGLPDYASWHFSSAHKLAARQQAQALFELEELSGLFARLGIDWVVLKGAAYIALQLPVAQGRTFADIDILVPRKHLTLIERQLRMRHWVRSHVDDYDDHYYRQWMHEIPPLRHARRGTILDVHHNILPLTNRSVPDVRQFELQCHQHPRLGPVHTLSDTDLCIHSAVHLFAEGEYQNGLRDLSDFQLLLQRFTAQDAGFVPRLLQRADTLGLLPYLQPALAECHRLLAAPVPEQCLQPVARRNVVLAWAWRRIFTPSHSSCRLPGHWLAAFLLYCRGHFLRMPLYLLLPHLLKKAWRRRFDEARTVGQRT